MILIQCDLLAVEELTAAKPHYWLRNRRCFKQLDTLGQQHRFRDAKVAGVLKQTSSVFCLLEYMQQCRIDALLPTRVEANAFCDLIGGFEADTAYLTESIRVLTNDVSRIPPVDLEEPHGTFGRYAKGRQQRDDVPRTPCLHIGVRDALQLFGADAAHFKQPFWFSVEDIQRFITEMLVDAAGSLFTDALDIAGAEIGDDTCLGRLYHLLKLRDSVLIAVLATLPTTLHIVADTLCGGQEITHRFNLPKRLSRSVEYLFMGRVHRHHEAGRIGLGK